MNLTMPLLNMTPYVENPCFIKDTVDVSCVLREYCPAIPGHLKWWAWFLASCYICFYAFYTVYNIQPWFRGWDDRIEDVKMFMEMRFSFLGFLLALIIVTSLQ